MKLSEICIDKKNTFTLPDDVKILNEVVVIGDDATIEKLTKMLDAAKRALGICNKLKDKHERRHYLSITMSGLNKIRHALKKMIEMENQ